MLEPLFEPVLEGKKWREVEALNYHLHHEYVEDPFMVAKLESLARLLPAAVQFDIYIGFLSTYTLL